MSCIVGERQFGRHFKRQFGRGQLRVKNCRETVGSHFLPRGIKMSRRALWLKVSKVAERKSPEFSNVCKKGNRAPSLATLIAWYNPRVPGCAPKSIGEGASSLFGGWPGSPENVSCSSATPDLHWCTLGVALEQEAFSGLPGHPPKRLLAPSPIDLGAHPGIRGLYQAVRVATLAS